MKRSWDPSLWKKSTKLLLGLATIWPHTYLLLFFVGLLSIWLFAVPNQVQRPGYCGTINPLELEQKIDKGELAELIVTPGEFIARNRPGTCEYRTPVIHEPTREKILQKARELDPNGVPRVAKIGSETKPDVSPAAISGFVALVLIHLFTIVLVLGLLAIYIILTVKNQRLDQTMRIVWVLLLALLTMFSMPLYWYWYVWRKPSEATESTRPQ